MAFRSPLATLAAAGAALAPLALAPAALAQVSRRPAALLDRSAFDPGEGPAWAHGGPTGWPIGPDGAPLGANAAWQARAAGFDPSGAPLGERPRSFGAFDAAGPSEEGLDLGSRFGAVTRGSAGADGALSTLDTGFESLATLPAELVNQLDTVQWGGASAGVTGRSHFSLVTGLVPPQYGVVSDPIAGNATKKLRGLASPAFGPNQFFGRWARCNFFKTNGATPGTGTRFIFRPDTGQDVRIVHDTFVNSITSVWTSEPTYVSSGFIVGRLIWGGINTTKGIGLPIGPIPFFYQLCPPCPNCDLSTVWCPLLTPAFYRSGEPYPGGAGQDVLVPVGSWFRIIHETTADGTLRYVIDRLDGHGEFVIFEGAPVSASGRVDRIAWAGGYDTANDAMYVDNVHAEGVEFVPPTPPPLECSGGQFTDNFEWMLPGPVAGQSTVVFDALSAHAVIAEIGAPQGKVLRRVNSFNDDRYRRENARTLPFTAASGLGPFRLCTRVSIPSAGFDPNYTVQTIAPASVSDGGFVTRLFIGRFDPMANPFYLPRVYVQINPDYNPIDDENTVDPYQPGPFGNGGVPVIGVDVADTSVNWVFNAFRNVCFDVDQNRNLTVSINGTTIHTGSSFVNSIDRVDFECENNNPGILDSIDYDDVALTCTVLPCACGSPPLTLVYNDDLEWALLNVTIGLQDDDNNPTTPFRWSSAANMPIVSLNTDITSKWLKMENLFRDTPAVAPDQPGFFSFTQASTALPHVTAGPTRGWTARADMRLTDGTTSRTWSVAQATISSAQFARVTALTFSSVTGTFWAQVLAPTMADPFATSWIDSGAGLAAFGAGFNQTFTLSIARNIGGVSGKCTFRINGKLLRYIGGPNNGAAVVVDPLASLANGTHKDMDRFFYLDSDESTAPAGSILYTDNIRAWSLPCMGDTNNNGVVDFADLNNVLGFFGQSGAPGTDITGNVGPDANNDGVPDDNTVNFTDLNLVLSGFGIPCTATN